MYEVQYADNAVTFEISSNNKLSEVYATTTSSVSAGGTITHTTCTWSSGPCGDVCHLGHYKNYWTELNFIHQKIVV